MNHWRFISCGLCAIFVQGILDTPAKSATLDITEIVNMDPTLGSAANASATHIVTHVMITVKLKTLMIAFTTLYV